METPRWTPIETEHGPGWEARPGAGADEIAPFAVVLLHDTPDDLAPAEPRALPSGPPGVETLAAALVDRGAAVVAPWGRASWWTDGGVFGPVAAEASIERRIAVGWSEWAAERFGLGRPQVALAGVGAGGHGALRIAYQHPQRYGAVAAWRPAVDCHRLLETTAADDPRTAALHAAYGDAERARQDSATLHIHPLNWPRNQWFGCPRADPWWDGADRLRMKLRSLGVPHEETLDDDLADGVAAERIAAWLAERVSG